MREHYFSKNNRTITPQFAPVVPIEVAREMELQSPGSLGNYHLLLAHDVLKRPKDYAEVYGGKGWTILMDNSIVELGEALEMSLVLAAAKIVGAEFTILPDVMGDYSATVESTETALNDWYGLSNEQRGNVKLLPVVQGSDLYEHMSFLLRFAGKQDIAGFCIPRIIADQCGTRKYIIEQTTSLAKVHLLGFSENLWDDTACARMPGVAGIDSAVPIRLGLQGKAISWDFPQNAGKRGVYWEHPFECETYVPRSRGEFIALAINNAKTFRRAISV